METKELDPETRKVLEDGNKVIRWVEGEEWKHVKSFLLKKIALLDSITEIPEDLNVEDRIREIDIRKGVIALVLTWIKDVEGGAEQARNNREAMKEIRQDGHIAYMP